MTVSADSTPLTLRAVRRMLEGVVPPALCTIAEDGSPHVNYLSQAEFVDDEHIALSWQFFNRSRENVLRTRHACLSIDDPYSATGVVIRMEYLKTETSGPVFERLRAKLAGIASQTGMENVFSLRGADLYRVQSLRYVPGRKELPGLLPRCDVQAGARALSEKLSACDEIPDLVDALMEGLPSHLRIEHAMLWLVERSRDCLVLLDSRGYRERGAGAEMPLTAGLAGVAAREGVPLRVGHMSKMYTYARAVRSQAESLGLDTLLHDEIPAPGLGSPRSQLAVPLVVRRQVYGVLFVESQHDQFFSYDDEDALMLLGGQLASAMALMRAPGSSPLQPAVRPVAALEPLRIRYVGRDHSIFLGAEYLIRGVAGAIFWKIANEHVRTGRSEFTNRELRGDPALPLPEVQDNLETRLMLLQRRLVERKAPIQIERCGRGVFRFNVATAIILDRAP